VRAVGGSAAAGDDEMKKPAQGGLGGGMLKVRESREVIQGFGCRYVVTRRVWLLFGLVPVWRVDQQQRLAG
jgi:hypothetical protein